MIRPYLNSTIQREADTVIPYLIFKLGLTKDIHINVIRQTADGSFQIMEKAYGNEESLNVFIVHSGHHFFLACPLFASKKRKSVVSTSQQPKVVRTGSYESIQFGPPPAEFFDDDSYVPAEEFFAPDI